jgi:hypothetical protein
MFCHGERVAVFCKIRGELITIDSIDHVDGEFIRLAGGGVFLAPHGESLTKPGSVRIIPAMPEHFTELRSRGSTRGHRPVEHIRHQ